MTSESMPRMQANAAFLKIQTQSLVRERILSDMDASKIARDANMTKLRELRLQRDALQRAAAAKAPAKPKARRARAAATPTPTA